MKKQIENMNNIANIVKDDTEMIQRLVNKACKEKGVLVFNPGKYSISKPIHIPSIVTLDGNGCEIILNGCETFIDPSPRANNPNTVIKNFLINRA